mmetsp:Transcript_52927/g.59157  ORF Transcript_52927/g.59157 Transcript_52927/m.59157 type:complete len:159 (+) Transcript_52927:111-587(+)
MSGGLAPLTAALDAVDVIDATDFVDADLKNNENENKNADFEDFERSMTLLAETVEEAQAAAATDSNTISNTTKMSITGEQASATDKVTTNENNNNNNKSSRFVTPKDFELLKVIGMGGALTCLFFVTLVFYKLSTGSSCPILYKYRNYYSYSYLSTQF